ncbi:MAG: hypothetical protein B6U85_04200 [Desulfurococcales archaeon ex4484_42]|nr:MAG: hypothetical protein B6U85_04200 [Desulfurococcales archaeon ex4484_42]
MPGVLKGIKYDDPLTRYRGEKVLSIAKRLNREVSSLDLDLAVDTFYSFYLPFPVTVPLNKVPKGKERNYYLIRELLDLQDFHKVKNYTIANTHMSTLISASFLEYVVNELKNEVMQGGKEGEEGSESIDRASISRAVKRAMEKVKEESKTLKNIQKLLSIGNEPGTGSVFDMEESGDEVIRLARNTDIKRLLEVISMVPQITHKVKRRVERSTKGELVGYELGSDLERVVPTELKLPKLYFRIKFVESKLLLYEKVLPKTLGPFYLLIDKSGSMEGEKIMWAKATAIALLMKARKENRDFYLRFFDGLPHPLIKVPRKMKTSDMISLIKYLARVKGGGGTDITRAIVTACDDITSGTIKSKSDVIIITDGEDRISETIVERKLKAANARLISVMILGENRDLRRLSHRYLRVLRLSGEEILKVVEA